MIIANANPSTSSMDTVTTVKKTVIQTTSQNPAAVVADGARGVTTRWRSQWV